MHKLSYAQVSNVEKNRRERLVVGPCSSGERLHTVGDRIEQLQFPFNDFPYLTHFCARGLILASSAEL